MMPGTNRSNHAQHYLCKSVPLAPRAQQVVVGAHRMARLYGRQMVAVGPRAALDGLKVADAGSRFEKDALARIQGAITDLRLVAVRDMDEILVESSQSHCDVPLH